MAEEVKNPEQAASCAAAPSEKNEKNENKAENKSEGKKRDNPKEAQIIRTFLQGVGMYEADALRVSIAVADGMTSEADLPKEDSLAVNRYLNFGLGDDQRTAEKIQEHRVSRSFLLMQRAADYCDKQQALLLNQALFKIAVSRKDIDEVVKNFDKRKKQEA